MKQFALLGHPLGHTLSPPIHERLFALSGVSAQYRVMDVPPEKFLSSWESLRQLDGFNVTIPYKEQIIPFCQKLDETAQRYKAVNVVDGNGKVGYNTDCVGFLKSLGEIPLGQRVLVIGAGGVGRMFAMESAFQGATVSLAVRRQGMEKAAALRQEIQRAVPGSRVSVVELSSLEGDSNSYDWLIQATPVGMFPQTDAMPVAESVLPRCQNVLEAIYNPGRTRLMQAAKKAGCHVVGGMGMLVWQAVQAHTIWYGAQFAEKQIQALIAEMEKKLEERL